MSDTDERLTPVCCATAERLMGPRSWMARNTCDLLGSSTVTYSNKLSNSHVRRFRTRCQIRRVFPVQRERTSGAGCFLLFAAVPAAPVREKRHEDGHRNHHPQDDRQG